MSEIVINAKNAAGRAADYIKKHRTLFCVVLFLIMLVVPLGIRKNGNLSIICRFLLYALLASSLNAINGYSGQTCIGQAGFYCIGAYTTAILATRTSIPFPLHFVCSGLAASVIGLLIALLTRKKKGVYLSIVTFGFSEIIRLIALNWISFTGGPMGIKNIPVQSFFGLDIKGPRTFYYIYVVLIAVFLFCTHRLIRSRVGRAWISIREDEFAAKSLGINTPVYKSINFMYGAFWAGVAGGLYALYSRYVDSTAFGLDTGWQIFSMVVVGGQGTLAGPILGSAIITLMTEALRPIGDWRMVGYALLIIITMWVRPQGIIGAKDSVLAGRKNTISRKRKAERAGEQQ